MTILLQALQILQHHKGSYYVRLGSALCRETQQPVVRYANIRNLRQEYVQDDTRFVQPGRFVHVGYGIRAFGRMWWRRE